jgi:hypothetical protein
MSQNNADFPPGAEEAAPRPPGSVTARPVLPGCKPLTDFHAKPKSLGAVTDRLIANRHRDGGGFGWWKRYGA